MEWHKKWGLPAEVGFGPPMIKIRVGPEISARRGTDAALEGAPLNRGTHPARRP
jgi:hypothetical protein